MIFKDMFNTFLKLVFKPLVFGNQQLIMEN